MRRLIILLCTWLFSINAYSQSNAEFDEKLLFRYTVEEIEAMESTNSARLDYLNFYVNNAFYFMEYSNIPEQKASIIPDILDFISLPENYVLTESITKNNFNILMYAVEFNENTRTEYRLGGGNDLLLIRSKNEIYDLYNQAQ